MGDYNTEYSREKNTEYVSMRKRRINRSKRGSEKKRGNYGVFGTGVRCSCGGIHGGTSEKIEFETELCVAALSALLFSASFIPFFAEYRFWLTLAALLLSETACLVRGVLLFLNGKHLNRDLLVVFSCIGTFACKNFVGGAAAAILYRLGCVLEAFVKNSGTAKIERLIHTEPESVTVVRDDEMINVSPTDIKKGEQICVFPNEYIPVDGIVMYGDSEIDMSPLNGEQTKIAVTGGNPVISGTLNLSGALTVRTTVSYRNSTIAKIVRTERSEIQKKSDNEHFAEFFSKLFFPAALAVALLCAALPVAFGAGDFRDWLLRALSIVTLSFPCAVTASVSASYFAGAGAMLKKGIIIKGSLVTDTVSKLSAAAISKTGIISKNKFRVIDVFPNEAFSKAEILQLACGAEAASFHPIAAAVRESAGNSARNFSNGERYEIPNLGVSWNVNGREVVFGSAKLMSDKKIHFERADTTDVPVYLSVGGKWIGTVIFSNPARSSIAGDISCLKDAGINKIAMMTGCDRQNANYAAGQAGIMEIYAELTSRQKSEIVKEICYDVSSYDYTTAFICKSSDDINALKCADIGIAFGADCPDDVLQASDLIILRDSIPLVGDAVIFSKKTKLCAFRNIVIILAVKAIMITLAVFGYSPLWVSVLTDSLIYSFTVFSAFAILRKEEKIKKDD